MVCRLLSVAFMVWSLGLVLWKYRRPFRLPQWLLFLVISVAASVGIAQGV